MIQGYTPLQRYIASQSPVPSTRDAFWQMVWEQQAGVVVMLAQAGDNDYCYWPGQGESAEFGLVQVALDSVRQRLCQLEHSHT